MEEILKKIYRKRERYAQMLVEDSFIDTSGNKIPFIEFYQLLGEDIYNLIKERIEQKLKEYEKRVDDELLECMKQDFIDKLKKEGKL
jgi:hypothetical protein